MSSRTIENYVYKKNVDWSVLYQGLSIPVNIQVIFKSTLQGYLRRGESKEIFLFLDGVKYSAKLVNQKFDERKYPNRTDIVQIRYNPCSDIAVKLRTIFRSTYECLLKQKEHIKANGERISSKLPEELQEQVVLYTTEYKDTYILECITQADKNDFYKTLKDKRIDETIYESSMLNYKEIDEGATLKEVTRVAKIRKLNRAIGDNLKLLYQYRCQICGCNFGAYYDANIVEAHHIIPFTKSLNNDAKNLIILCPNHHRVVHAVALEFDYKKLEYKYKNGLVDKIKFNKHL